GDIDARRIETLSLQGRLERASAEPWLPPTVGFDHVTWQATAHGAINALEHEGELRTREVAVDPLKPASVVLAWRGRMLEADVDATTEVPDAAARFEARVHSQGATIRSLTLTSAEGETFH